MMALWDGLSAPAQDALWLVLLLLPAVVTGLLVLRGLRPNHCFGVQPSGTRPLHSWGPEEQETSAPRGARLGLANLRALDA